MAARPVRRHYPQNRENRQIQIGFEGSFHLQEILIKLKGKQSENSLTDSVPDNKKRAPAALSSK